MTSNSALSGCHLLLVEDNDLATLLVPRLNADGWIVRSSTSGREACYVAREQYIDVLVVALRLPDERGDAVCYRLAVQYPRLRTRTLFLVENADERTLATGVNGHWIQLPSTPDEIAQRLLMLFPKRDSDETRPRGLEEHGPSAS